MKKTIIITIAFVLIIIGIVIGLMIDSMPFITLEKEFGFGDIANFLLALVLAIVIPVSLNTWLDNERHIKDHLIDEIKDCISELKLIKQKIDDCNISKKFEEQDRREMLSKISCFEMKISSVRNQLKSSFKRSSSEICEDLYPKYIEYWIELTGGELMNKDFKISYSFCKNHNRAYLKIEGYLKSCIHVINRF